MDSKPIADVVINRRLTNFYHRLFIPWGNYQFAVRDFEGSKESFLYALKQYEDVGKVMYHPDATACLYKIGRAALEEGDLVYAM